MKALPAILAALATTVVVGVAMLLIGGNALLNRNTLPISNSPSITNISSVSAATGSTDQQVAQLQSLVQQYQQREQQYQAQLNEAANRLNQDNQQLAQAQQDLQSYQQLISMLQQSGVIRITADGQVYILRGGRGGGDDNGAFNDGGFNNGTLNSGNN
jgi:ATP-dependent protease HslVU (ClpYQ) peptidase subunit